MILLNSASSNRHRNLASFSIDSDASAYFSAVEAASSTIGATARKAVNNFIIGLKADGLWSLIHELYLYAGPDTLNGALVKAKGTGTRVNNGFVSGDFSPTLGLQGDGTSKYIANNFLASSFAPLSNSIFVYSSSGFNNSGNKILSGNYPSNLAFPADRNGLISLDAYATYVSARAFRSGTYVNGEFPISYVLEKSGSIFGSRTSATMAKLYKNGLPVATSTSSINPSFASQDIFSFGLSNNGVLNSGSATSDRRQVEVFAQGLNDNQASILHKRTATYIENLLAFSPLSLNPALWLDASDASTLYNATSGGGLVDPDGTVARWEDKSGGGKHVIQATSANQPQRKIAIKNGRDVLSFEADLNRFLTGSSILHSSSVTVFVIAKIPDIGGGTDASTVLQTSNAANGLGFSLKTSSGFRDVYIRGVSNGSDGAYVTNTWNLLSVKYSSNLRSFFIDKVAATLNTPNGTMINPTAGIIIGRNDLGTNFAMQGSIGEIIIYSTALSDADRVLVENYLATKWAI